MSAIDLVPLEQTGKARMREAILWAKLKLLVLAPQWRHLLPIVALVALATASPS
jgi:hypothetical protein